MPFSTRLLNSSWLLVFLAAGCRKETVVELKEIVKQASWQETGPLAGLERVILSTGHDSKALYLQQPNTFSRFSGGGRPTGDFRAVGRLPADVMIRLPIGRDFHAYPASDSLLVICRNNEPFNYEAYVHLRRVDPTALRFTTRLFSLSKCMAINENNYLLSPYETNRSASAITFLLTAVTPGSPGTPVTSRSRLLTIPVANSAGNYVRNVAAIDNYFLVNLGNAGLYKIYENGTFRQVYGVALADAFYKWQGTLYAPVEYNQILTSQDAGETWQLSTGTPDHFTLASYYPVGDSLVGVYGTSLYSVRWQGARYATRFLKNDGLERTTITGIEYLRDTVYVATTAGLFARSLKTFFESK